MVDNLNPAQRSACMAAIRGEHTQPECILRKALHRAGYRYRCNYPYLPGKPDVIFPVCRKIIFVHGCFWHRHRCKKGRSTPLNRKRFWEAKFHRNIERDRQVRKRLHRLGWQVLIIWECQINRQPEKTIQRAIHFLQSIGANTKKSKYMHATTRIHAKQQQKQRVPPPHLRTA